MKKEKIQIATLLTCIGASGRKIYTNSTLSDKDKNNLMKVKDML